MKLNNLSLSLILIILFSSFTYAQTSQKSITVNGQHKMALPADVLYCDLNVSSNNYQMKNEEFNKKVEGIVEFLGIKDDLLNPNEVYNDCTTGLYKYLKLKISSDKRFNEIKTQLDKIKNSNQGLYIDLFSNQKIVSEESLQKKEIEMFKKAVQQGKEKAEMQADALGYKIGEIITIIDSPIYQDYNYNYANNYGGFPEASTEDASDNSLGNQKYVKMVTVTFELKK